MLGKKIQQLRKENGMSQEELASKLTISRQAISKWELGESMPDTENIVQLSKLFNVSTDYLLNDEYGSEMNDAPAPISEVSDEKDSEILSDSTGEGNIQFSGIRQYIKKPALWIIATAIIVVLPLSVFLINEVLKTSSVYSVHDSPTNNYSTNSTADSPTLNEEIDNILEPPLPIEKPVAIAYGERQIFDFTLSVGERIPLNALAELANPGYENIVWTSSNQSIFEVEATNSTGTEANVTAIGRGTATLIVALGDAQTQCTVRVGLNNSDAEGNDVIIPSILPLDFAWPVPGYKDIVKEFGIRLHPIEHIYISHNGIDIAAPLESPVVASEAGTVIDLGEAEEDGHFVKIDHGYSIQTIYSNLQGHAEGLAVGDTVGKGDLIGYVGVTKSEDYPHLHFGMMVDERDTNPMKYF